jgi:sigma-B regulation protein RsbU (phosphoserine phosphatase)
MNNVSETPDKLLLVDDNPTNLQVLTQTLNGQGYELLIAMNGEMALSIARKAQPALILLDIMMPPGIDGYEVCRQLKEDPVTRETDVIFLSALDDTKDKVRGLDLGAVDYVSKPFKADEVTARVNTHMTNYRLRRNLAQANAELESANERMKKDLVAAARVQQALLPHAPPTQHGLEFAWRCIPCDELAGDSLSVFRIDDRNIGMYVVDVSGHGVPSALLSVAVTRSLSVTTDRSSLVVESSDETGELSIVRPAEVARRLNAIYDMDTNGMLYLTVVYGILDTEEMRFRYVCAGHPGPIVVRKDETAHTFDAPAVPIGMLEDSEYEDSVLELQPGDRLYLHSDGLHEERNASREQLGMKGLLSTIDSNRAVSLDESLDALSQAVAEWKGDDNFSDDVTVLAVEVTDS